jgi:hypothetical protein
MNPIRGSIPSRNARFLLHFADQFADVFRGIFTKRHDTTAFTTSGRP